ncbi:MAG TPA: DUF357 domain-containing protein [Candidatus Methanoculleus thermohydrogenotrophicum]|jgi:hypothetical protein|nr:DUF357 domain-containing protein [Candidatus Methanoculleus thermohydrogenotrophicum]HOB17351.1 DUF357 domain-containing protein [Candidatus Methanoculleus thermohydrogenotrophicum]HPZ37506.1 DUF357 domain-containing protein [Candidatus Methanoculleus thermohydrogenotrophicum]HQC90958.1 DUF357 domain-containing protein [Candidatus Methanoculleus thermohydrogenotrophicum]
MTLEDYGALFAQALSRTGIAVPEETLLHRAAEEVLEMAAAYESDGRTFLRSGDLVNALAGFAYGLGWLDCGCRLGLLAPLAAHPPGEVDVRIPDTESAHLHEKTHRYQRMLHSALAMVEPGPDEASPLHAGSGDLHAAARFWYVEGAEHLEAGDLAGALARFSYGYAWLDAGIRAGLLRVTGERGLFTV